MDLPQGSRERCLLSGATFYPELEKDKTLKSGIMFWNYRIPNICNRSEIALEPVKAGC